MCASLNQSCTYTIALREAVQELNSIRNTPSSVTNWICDVLVSPYSAINNGKYHHLIALQAAHSDCLNFCLAIQSHRNNLWCNQNWLVVFSHPFEKICSSNWIISPEIGVNIKNIWVATTWKRCHCFFQSIEKRPRLLPVFQFTWRRKSGRTHVVLELSTTCKLMR